MKQIDKGWWQMNVRAVSKRLLTLGITSFFLFPFLLNAQNAVGNVSAESTAVKTTTLAWDTTHNAQPLYLQHPSMGGHYLKLLFITFVLLLLFWLAVRYMRKLQFGNEKYKNARITVLNRQYLTSKHSIWLVVIGDQKYLLGVSDHAVNLIDRLGPVSEQELNQARQMSLPSFGSFLEKLRKK